MIGLLCITYNYVVDRMTENGKYSDFIDMLRKKGLSRFERLSIDENMNMFSNIYRHKSEDIILEIRNPELYSHKFSWMVIIGINQFTDESGSGFLSPYKIKISDNTLNIELIQKWSEGNSKVSTIDFMKNDGYYTLETGIHLVRLHDDNETLRLRISGHNVKNMKLSDVEFCIEVDLLMFHKLVGWE